MRPAIRGLNCNVEVEQQWRLGVHCKPHRVGVETHLGMATVAFCDTTSSVPTSRRCCQNSRRRTETNNAQKQATKQRADNMLIVSRPTYRVDNGRPLTLRALGFVVYLGARDASSKFDMQGPGTRAPNNTGKELRSPKQRMQFRDTQTDARSIRDHKKERAERTDS